MLETLEQAVVPNPGRYQARKQLKEYQDAYDAGNHQYGEILQVCRQIAMQRTVISVNKAMQIAGVKANGYPVLAIAAADAKWCWFVQHAGWIKDGDRQWSHPASAFVSDYTVNPAWRKPSYRRATKRSCFRFLRETFPTALRDEIRARVPTVPPRCLQNAGLHNYLIMWEADWNSAPKDPILLRRITREFFVVLAEWNLTKVEQIVLEMAAFQSE